MPKIKNTKRKYNVTIFPNQVKYYDRKGGLYNVTLKDNSRMIGQHISINNIRFQGEWKKAKQSGKDVFIQHKGTWIWPNGDWFSGYLKNGIHSDGQGQRSSIDGKIFYGVYKDGLPYSGRIHWDNGNWFEGFIYKNRPYNGRGSLKLPNEIFFAGTFKNGFLYDGVCKFYSDDKTYMFEGQLKKGKMWEGKKTITFTDEVSYIKEGKEYSKLDILSEVAYNIKTDN